MPKDTTRSASATIRLMAMVITGAPQLEARAWIVNRVTTATRVSVVNAKTSLASVCNA